MSSEQSVSGSSTGGETTTEADDQQSTTAADLRGQLELLQEENQRLRREYIRARQTRYRRTAVALLAVGVIALSSGIVVQEAQQILIALGGSAIFAGILTYYLTPEEFVAATVGETVTRTLQGTYADIQSELELDGDPTYLPPSKEGVTGVRLFVPQHTDYTLPASEDLDRMFVVPESASQRGVSLQPTGQQLFDEFQTATNVSPTTAEPARVFDQLADGLVEQFELADQVSATVTEEQQCVVAVEGSRYGNIDVIDHPISSFLAVGAAEMLEHPIQIDVRTTEGSDFIIQCQWN